MYHDYWSLYLGFINNPQDPYIPDFKQNYWSEIFVFNSLEFEKFEDSYKL